MTNIRVRERTKVIDIISNVRKMKWSWAGHIKRLKDDRWTSRVTTWRPYDKQIQQEDQPLKRWIDDLDMLERHDMAEDSTRQANLETVCWGLRLTTGQYDCQWLLYISRDLTGLSTLWEGLCRLKPVHMHHRICDAKCRQDDTPSIIIRWFMVHPTFSGFQIYAKRGELWSAPCLQCYSTTGNNWDSDSLVCTRTSLDDVTRRTCSASFVFAAFIHIDQTIASGVQCLGLL